MSRTCHAFLFFIFIVCSSSSLYFLFIFSRDMIRDPIHDPIRSGPIRSDPGFLDAGLNIFYRVNGLSVGLCILCVKMRTFLCGEGTIAA